MISVRYCSIPSYLHDGSFYRSLNADESEGEIQIPDRCYSVNGDVQNVQDFAQLLRVTDFWGLTNIPLSVIRFCDIGSKEWADQIKEEHSEKQCAQDLLYIFNEPSDSAVTSNRKQDSSLVRAIMRDRTEIVKYLALSPSEGTQAISAAADMGRLDFIQVLHQHGHAWAFDACTLATRGGHLDCLKYLHENGCPSYVPALQFAVAKSGNLSCLKYLFAEGVPWDRSSNHIAANGNLDMLKFAAENGCTFDKTATSYAAQNGHAECLRYLLYEFKCVLCEHALIDACFHGHVACVKLLREYGVEWDRNASVAAANGGHLSVLQYLHVNKCPWDGQVSTIAAKKGNYDMLLYVLNHGGSCDAHLLTAAARNVSENGLKCFKYLVEELHEPTADTNAPYSATFNEAFVHGNYYIVRYLYERNPVHKKHTIVWPYWVQWQLEKRNIETDALTLAKMDSNVLQCIQCALENDWDIDACGGKLIEFLEKVYPRLPRCFECVKPWHEKRVGSNKRKEVA